MHRSSLCEACLGWKPLAPPPFPVETYHRTISAFSRPLRSRNPQKHPFLPNGTGIDSSNTPRLQNLVSPFSI